MPEYENRTRRELDAALRELLKRKPLDQIRVRELTEYCGLRRQSFYYHFKDVYELFHWCVYKERELLLAREAECLTWQQALKELLAHIEGNRDFYQAVLDDGGQKELGEMIPAGEALAAVRLYYWERCGAGADEKEQEQQYGEALLLSLLEGWIRNTSTLAAEELISSLERLVERGMDGVTWRTLRERGDWLFY